MQFPIFGIAVWNHCGLAAAMMLVLIVDEGIANQFKQLQESHTFMGFRRNHTRDGRDQNPSCGSDHTLAGDAPIVLVIIVTQFHFKDVQSIQTLGD